MHSIRLAFLALVVIPFYQAIAKHAEVSGADIVTARPVQVIPANEVGNTALVFMSARCPCSASHEALLKKMAKEFPEVRFVGVHSNADEPEAEAKAHFAKADLPFPVIQDAQAKIATEFGALKTPHVFVIAKNGDVVFSGGVTDSHEASRATKNYLQVALLSLRAGKNPDPSEVRSLGCYIARK